MCVCVRVTMIFDYDTQQWFKSLPIVTRYWFGITLVLTVAGNFGILSPYYYVFVWKNIVNKFEVWRVATCFCYAGGFDFNTLICMYTLVTFSKNYETGGPFNTGAGGESKQKPTVTHDTWQSVTWTQHLFGFLVCLFGPQVARPTISLPCSLVVLSCWYRIPF